jgi:hypothetical protein
MRSEGFVLRAPLLAGERVAFLEVGSGAEGLLARAREHHAAAPLLGLEAPEKIAQVERCLRVERIADLGAVEGREEDILRPFLHPQRGVLLHACSAAGRPPRPA